MATLNREFQIKDLEKTSPFHSIIRQFTWLDLSLWHALFMSIVGTVVWVGGFPNLDFDSFSLPGGFWTTTTTPQVIVFTISISYFIYDMFCIFYVVFQRKKFSVSTAEKGFIFHHLICITSLSLPIVYRVDTAIVFSGFIAGELSNPFRGTAEIIGKDLTMFRRGIREYGEATLEKCGYPKAKVQKIFRTMMERQVLIDDIHYWLLAPLRFSCYYLYLTVFRPLVVLFTTPLTAHLIIAFTVVSLVFLKIEADEKKAVWKQLSDPFQSDPLEAVDLKTDINDDGIKKID